MVVDLVLIMCEKDVGNYQSPGVKGETTVSCSGDC